MKSSSSVSRRIFKTARGATNSETILGPKNQRSHWTSVNPRLSLLSVTVRPGQWLMWSDRICELDRQEWPVFIFVNWKRQSRCAICLHSMSRLAQIDSVLGPGLAESKRKTHWRALICLIHGTNVANQSRCRLAITLVYSRPGLTRHPPALTDTPLGATVGLVSATETITPYYWPISLFIKHSSSCVASANSITSLFLALLDPSLALTFIS